MEESVALHFNKLDSPFSRDALSQVWLKSAQLFWRKIKNMKKNRRKDGHTDLYVKFTMQILHLREITVVIFLDTFTAFECLIFVP